MDRKKLWNEFHAVIEKLLNTKLSKYKKNIKLFKDKSDYFVNKNGTINIEFNYGKYDDEEGTLYNEYNQVKDIIAKAVSELGFEFYHEDWEWDGGIWYFEYKENTKVANEGLLNKIKNSWDKFARPNYEKIANRYISQFETKKEINELLKTVKVNFLTK